MRYQITALRQVFAKVAETGDETHDSQLQAVLKSHPRKGMDAVYEPLNLVSCDQGIAELVRLGEVAKLPGGDEYHLRITHRATRRFLNFPDVIADASSHRRSTDPLPAEPRDASEAWPRITGTLCRSPVAVP